MDLFLKEEEATGIMITGTIITTMIMRIHMAMDLTKFVNFLFEGFGSFDQIFTNLGNLCSK